MKHSLSLWFTLGSLPLFAAPPPPPAVIIQPPPTVVQALPQPVAAVPVQPAPPAQAYVYEQRPLASVPALVKPEVAKGILDRFKTSYSKMGNPRLLIYVNRELIDEESGLRLSNRVQRTEVNRSKASSDYKADTSAPKEAFPQGSASKRAAADSRLQPGKGGAESEVEKTSREESFHNQPKPAAPSLADKQTLRDIERLFGRPLRMCGARLADQKVATQILGDAALRKAAGASDAETARKEREATREIADVVIEILITSKNLVMPGIGSDRIVSVPDIQATAVRLSDAQILGQATSADILGKDRNAAQLSAVYDVRDVSEATALALMEDIMLSVPPTP